MGSDFIVRLVERILAYFRAIFAIIKFVLKNLLVTAAVYGFCVTFLPRQTDWVVRHFRPLPLDQARLRVIHAVTPSVSVRPTLAPPGSDLAEIGFDAFGRPLPEVAEVVNPEVEFLRRRVKGLEEEIVYLREQNTQLKSRRLLTSESR